MVEGFKEEFKKTPMTKEEIEMNKRLQDGCLDC